MLTRRNFLMAAAMQPAVDARQDRQTLIFEGRTPNKLCCDTTLRAMPDGSWAMVMLGGGDKEPLPENDLFLSRSRDEGRTWSAMEPIRLGIKEHSPNRALVPTELMVYRGVCRLYFANHDGTFRDWTTWVTESKDSCRTWSEPRPIPHAIHKATFVRNTIIRRDGAVVVPYQHYESDDGPRNPRNGVMISRDHCKTFTLHGSIRISSDDNYRGFAENNVVELNGRRMAMLIRADRLGGVLFRSDSADGGETWGPAYPTDIPNPGSKATLYSLGGDRVALLHNPDPKVRNPLSLWVSFDGMKTWPYRRDLVTVPGRLNYPDGFVSRDRKYLHFAYDDNRYKAVYYGARLPS
ncbi:MAG: exo-alpha-sialidase [Bryobacterales bacterium]|nr:exo-alpha-sialidase [Bryobacterales bacterium]